MMSDKQTSTTAWPTLSRFTIPMKILMTCLLMTLSLGLVGALGQIIVHDIIPTFFADGGMIHAANPGDDPAPQAAAEEGRGDLFGDAAPVKAEPEKQSLLDNDQFIWTLRWTHIHLFGMSMIFILLGAVTAFLDMPAVTKSWLIVLPFVGVVVDIASMWLKGFVSPVFFWLHLPGGGLFAGIFIFVFFRALAEMWAGGFHENT